MTKINVHKNHCLFLVQMQITLIQLPGVEIIVEAFKISLLIVYLIVFVNFHQLLYHFGSPILCLFTQMQVTLSSMGLLPDECAQGRIIH